jgi:hypothetical protein
MFGGLPPPKLFTAEVATPPSAWRTDETGNAWPRSPDVVVTLDPTLETSLPTTLSAGVSTLPPALLGGVPGVPGEPGD